jgi:hypothetical protein
MGFAAFNEYAKERSLSHTGYLKVLDKAHELGYRLLSAGADTNFYGYDYSLGLLEFKSSIRMIPHPEEPFNLVRLLNTEKFAKDGKAGYFFFSVKRKGEFYDRLLAQDGEPKTALELMNGSILTEDTQKPEDIIVGNHFYFDDVPISSPKEVETVRRKIEPVADADRTDGQKEIDLESKIVTSPRGMKMAKFRANEYKPEYDAALKKLGAHTVFIDEPTRNEIESYDEEQGFYLQPRWVAWMAPAAPLKDYIAGLASKSRRKSLHNNVKRGENLRAEIKPLTVEDYEAWWPIYNKIMTEKPGGVVRHPSEWARKEVEEKGSLDTWYSAFYYDPEDGSLLGGQILYVEEERGFVGGAWAAYRQRAKDLKLELGVQGVVSLLKLAEQKSLPMFSQGKDTNLYGYDYNPGLMARKSLDGMTPYPGNPIGLLKVLDPTPFTESNYDNKRAGYFFFSLKREGEFYKRYLESVDAGGERPSPEKLLGGFLRPQGPSPSSIMVLNHFTIDDDVKVPTPTGIDVIRRKIESDGSES